MNELQEEIIERLYELADEQHPHMKGSNHTRKMIDKAFSNETMTAMELFDCGKYYQRMLEQLQDNSTCPVYLKAILEFKNAVYRK